MTDMTRQQANWQSLAASGAYFIMITGIAHEVVGPTLFPWAPDFFGTVIWHLLGASVFSSGVLLLAGTLNAMRFPVVAWAIVVAIFSFAVVIFFATRHEFHFFALCVSGSAVLCAIAYRKSRFG